MRRARVNDPIESPDMTPMLDVVFIMLIFFIVTTSFVKESGVDILTLTNQSDGKPPKGKILTLKLTRSGESFLQNELINIESLQARVQSVLSKSDVSSAVVSVDSQVPTMVLVKAVDDIRLAGIENVSVAKSY